MIKLPAHITGAQPTGAPDTLRVVRPTFLAPALTDTKAHAHAIGTHVVRLPRRFEARSAKIDNTPVLIARDGKAVHVLTYSVSGIVEVVGWNAEQVAGVHEWLDAAAAAPENQTELAKFLESLPDRNGGRPIEGKDLTPAEAARLGKLMEDERLMRLSASVDPLVDNSYVATRASGGDAREVDRLVALAATLYYGARSGDGEIDRLVRLADNLSDG
ncbi:hypothetical protein [uncultured Microbacterium sp.]|uniref:hypothetical protein n=1 Tax=uncultured Microbacterium sp. TaxID=191216 RepID=UPI0025D445CF|nr:hypothetical protein [uncultured Microbacterium sp.]